MRPFHKFRTTRVVLAFWFTCLGIVHLQAGVRRHDVADADHTGLGAAVEYESVGAILGTTTTGDFLCSSTLIETHQNPAESWMVTAAHCLPSNLTSLTFGFALKEDGQGWVEFDGPTFNALSWLPHPDWTGDLSKGRDIGLFKTEAIPDITPAALFDGDERALEATIVGFGLTGTGDTVGDQFRSLDGKKRAGVNTVDVHYRTPGKGNRIFGVDFDNPQNPADSSWGSTIAQPKEYISYKGDSGGAAFVSNQLAGVTSFGQAPDGIFDSDYGDRAGFTRITSYKDWIAGEIGGGGGGNTGGNGKGNGRGGKPKKSSASFGFPAIPITGELDNLVGVASTSMYAVPEPSGGGLALWIISLLGLKRFRTRTWATAQIRVKIHPKQRAVFSCCHSIRSRAGGAGPWQRNAQNIGPSWRYLHTRWVMCLKRAEPLAR